MASSAIVDHVVLTLARAAVQTTVNRFLLRDVSGWGRDHVGSAVSIAIRSDFASPRPGAAPDVLPGIETNTERAGVLR